MYAVTYHKVNDILSFPSVSSIRYVTCIKFKGSGHDLNQSLIKSIVVILVFTPIAESHNTQDQSRNFFNSH